MPSSAQLISLVAVAAALLHPVSASVDDIQARRLPRHQRSKAAARLARSNTMPDGWSLHSACLTDAPAPNRLLSESFNFLTTLTPAVCATQCASAGFTYAAVQDGHECWCGSELATGSVAGKSVSATECNIPCAGDATKMCGGYYALSLYSNKSKNVYKSYSSKLAQTKTSSIAQTTSKAGTTTTKKSSTSTTSSSHAATSSTTSSSKYELIETMAGSSFFSHFDFYSYADPTNGMVNYLDGTSATSKGLAYVSNGQAIMQVDNTTTLASGANRNSVRITSKNAYSTGLMIFDIAQMPYGCSVWPAMWTTGPNWPSSGEVDIIEGVNNATVNQLTLHTGSSTTCSTASLSSNAVSTSFMNKECASSPTSDAGCGFQDTSSTAFGAGFNKVGGAVYALLIDANSGTTIWKFGREKAIPSDITSGSPNPSSWGTPQASWPSSDSCKTGDTVVKQNIVFDITLCGGWTESDYPNSGCPGTCADMVKNPSNYNNAVWKVNSVKVYQ